MTKTNLPSLGKKILLFQTLILLCCSSFAGEDLFKKGRALQRDGKYEEAIEAWNMRAET